MSEIHNNARNEKKNATKTPQTHKILPARIRQRARQLTQRNPHTRRNEREEDQAIDDLDGTPAVDARDQGGGDAPPGVGEGEADAKEGVPGVVALEVLGVAHLGEGEGIAVEGLEVVVGGGGVGGGDVVEGGFLEGHGQYGKAWWWWLMEVKEVRHVLRAVVCGLLLLMAWWVKKLVGG